MSNPPPTKSLTGHHPAPVAPQLMDTPALGEPKDVARQGVPSALRPESQYDDGRRPIAWLHIAAPRGAVPTATSKCLCGRDRSAIGHRKVLALIDDHAAHRDTCPLRTLQEGRNAA